MDKNILYYTCTYFLILFGVGYIHIENYEAKIWCKFWSADEKSPILGHFAHSKHHFETFYHYQTVQPTEFVYVEGIKNQKIIIEPIFVLAGKWRVWSTCILALFQTAVRKI